LAAAKKQGAIGEKAVWTWHFGVNSTTAGLTLGAGFGWTSRKLGLSIDNLVSVDVVTADGQLRRADAEQHADPYWAVGGGGGNFGVATSFECGTCPCPWQAYCGPRAATSVCRLAVGVRSFADTGCAPLLEEA
jgi:hypothetical protein